MFVISIFVGSLAQAQDVKPEDLQGARVRVGDGCRELSEEELKSLSANGGGNTARRRMVITFGENRFHAKFWPSLRCENNFEKKDSVNFGNESIRPECTSLERVGGLTFLRDNMIQLDGEDVSKTTAIPGGATIAFGKLSAWAMLSA